jgi:predicted dehydrogenase
VLCEKPLALRVDEVDAMTAAAESAGVLVAEGFMYRHHPRTMEVKALIDDGAIGELHFVRGAFTFPLTRPGNPRWIPEMGGGSLWDVGCYPLSFARYVVGAEPLDVYGRQVEGPTGVDMTFAAQLTFPGNVLAQFDSGFRSQFRMEMAFVGSTGMIQLPRAFKPGPESTILLTRGDDTETLTVPGPELLYLGEVEDVADAVLGGSAPRISLADSRANIAAIHALLASARSGQPVSMSRG